MQYLNPFNYSLIDTAKNLYGYFKTTSHPEPVTPIAFPKSSLDTTSPASLMQRIKKMEKRLIFWNPETHKCSRAAIEVLNFEKTEGYELDLSGYQFLNNGKFQKIVQAAKNLSALNLQFSDIDDKELAAAIPILKLNSPDLKAIHLGGVYYSKETLRKLLESFPELEKINLDLIQKSVIQEQEVAEVVTPWLKNNTKLQSFESSYNAFSEKAILEFIEAMPATLKKFGMGFWGNATSNQFIKAMQALSEKCGQGLQELIVDGTNEEGEGKTKGVIDEKSFPLLPDLFPNLQILDADYAAITSLPIIQQTYLKWKELKNLDLSNTNFKSAELDVLIQHFKNLKIVDLGWSEDGQVLAQIAPDLIKNSGSTLKKLCIFYPFSKEGVDPGLEAIQSLLPQLESFEFDHSQLNVKNLNFIVKYLGTKISAFHFDKHQENHLPSYDLATAVLTLAQRCPDLKNLTLTGSLFSPELKPDLTESIPAAFKRLEKLDLSCLTAGNIKALILSFIKHNPLLQVIDVGQLLSESDIQDLRHEEPKIGKTIRIRTSELN